MASSSKVVYYTSKTNKDGSHPICIRLTFNRKRKYVTIANVHQRDWDEAKQIVRRSHPNYRQINKIMKEKDAEAEELVLEYDMGNGNLSIEQIVNKLKGNKSDVTLVGYMNQYIQELKAKNQESDASSKISMKKTIVKLQGGSLEIPFSSITSEWLRKLEIELGKGREGKKPASKRTIFNYMNFVRTLYNRAVADGVASKDRYPFTNYKLVMPESEKFGLDREEIEALIDVEISDARTNAWELAKWAWLLSLSFGGVRFGDLLKMKWEDMKNGRYYYVMGKNNKPVSLQISNLAQQALDYFEQYKENSKGYVIPELCKANLSDLKDINLKIRNANRWYNRQLKQLAELAGITKPLSMHSARHSFGNLTGDKISPQLLQQIYKHSDIKTTMNYQQHWMNQEKMDEAINNVVDF